MQMETSSFDRGHNGTFLVEITIRRRPQLQTPRRLPMQTLIVYSSQTGNTRRLAEAAYECLPGAKQMHPITTAPPPDGYDLIVVGFWLKAGRPDAKAAQYLRRIADSAVFLMATHGAASGSDHALKAMQAAEELVPHANVLGTFNCRGEVNAATLAKIRSQPHPPDWAAQADRSQGHPDAADIANLQERIVKAITPKL
jgi:hypothetical protein